VIKPPKEGLNVRLGTTSGYPSGSGVLKVEKKVKKSKTKAECQADQ